MKTLLKSTVLFLGALVISCASSSKATPEEIAALDEMVSNKHFEVTALWAQPLASQSLNSIANAGLLPQGSTASRIDISGSRGYLRVVGDSVMADLPYFGERRMGGYYSANRTGIQFKDVPKEFSIDPAEKGTGYMVKFTVNDGAENYQVIAQLYPNQTARLTVASSHRTNIWYQGNLSEYKE